ncbi:hypothetical protein ACF07Y_38945 [Streptomyces sp. NPDC016566]|uniref:hypothetical protein n=1 Tax=Streptomyces sp. NPDC016566 TaxID=3364967 RepID=UPI0036F568D4
MDLQGVGAIAAAVAAMISVPVTVRLARLQMRGDVQTAEAAYRAALDAAKEQGSAAHMQWRRSVQRDAYSAFLLSSTQVQVKTEALMAAMFDVSVDLSLAVAELGHLREELKAKLVVVELEGPDPVVEAARNLSSAVILMSDSREEYVASQRTRAKLDELVRESDPTSRGLLSSVQNAVSGLSSAIALCNWRGDWTVLLGNSHTNPLPEEVRSAVARLQQFLRRLPRETFTQDEQFHLIASAAQFSNFVEERREYLRGKEEFVRAARATLG